MTDFCSVLTWREPGEAWRDCGRDRTVLIHHTTDREARRKAYRAVALGLEWRLEVFPRDDDLLGQPSRVLYGKRVARTKRRMRQ